MAGNTQINRWYELTIGDGITYEAVVITPPMGVRFTVDKSSTILRKQDTGQIEVFNLSSEALAKLKGDYPIAILNVGYEKSDLVTILKGNVISVSTDKQGSDTVTKIQIGSSYVDLNHQSLQAVIPEGKTVKSVIEYLQQSMSGSVSRGVYSGFGIYKKVLYGYPINGTPKSVLDNICRTYHLDYHIDHGTLYVHDAEGTIDENYALAPVISESSGMIDFPYDTRVAVGKAKKSVDNKGGVHFKVLLNPTLVAGSIVKIQSRDISGWYKIADLRHFGGNRENDWYTECRCEDKNRVNKADLDLAESEGLIE